MNPFYEPNAFEKAEDYLNNFKETHTISTDKETKLLVFLEDYFDTREGGSPMVASEIWAKVNEILISCETKVNK